MTVKPIPTLLARSLAASLLLVPPGLLAVLLWRDSVNVPYWDEWNDDIAGLFVKSKTGQLSLGDFWVQHNESRLVLPRIFFLLLGSLTHWNLGCEVAATFLLAGVIGGAVFCLGRTTFPDRPVARWAVFFISSLLIFSPAQSEAWLWGLEIILYVPLACILFSLLALRSQLSRRAKFIFCAGLATMSTYSFSNGLLAWIVLFPPLFFWDGFYNWRRKNPAMLGWALCFAANCALYFHDYQFPPANGFWHLLWSNPWPIAEYFSIFLGGPLVNRYAPTCQETAAIIGFVLAILFAASCILVFKWRKNSALTNAAWPWLTIGGYGILSALLATSGRAALGAEQALSPRYGIFGISLIVALVYLIPILVFHRASKNDLKKSGDARMGFGLVTLGAIIVLLHGLAFPANILNLSVFRLDLLQAKCSLQFLDALPPRPASTTFLYPDYQKLKRTADALNQLGVRNDSLLKTVQLADFKINPKPGCGSIEYGQPADGNFLVSGWAVSAAHKAAADCVVFTYEGDGIKPVIFALMDQRLARADLVAKFHDPIYRAAGWQKTISLSDLPKGALTVKAWIYDVESRQLTPVQNQINLENK